jgi:hypothetical protein
MYREHLNHRKEFKIYYTDTKVISETKEPIVIFMADGKIGSGGLADRLKGITSVYKLCKKYHIKFKVNFISPFKLNDYLLPNNYDWNISPDEISYNKDQVKLCFIYSKYDFPFNVQAQLFWAKKFFKSNYKQLHIYTNMSIAEDDYGLLFEELFKPTAELNSLVSYHLKQINDDFISTSFRFQCLLGDFFETDSFVLPQNERKLLIERCVMHLKEIYEENNYKKVLVTSDSITFLSDAKKLNFVYTVPGAIAHIDFSHDLNKQINLKLFIDYFLLSLSKKIYLVIDGNMYESNFPYRASLHNKIPFIIKRYT